MILLQDSHIERTSRRESSNRKTPTMQMDVCVNEMNSIHLTQTNKQGTLARVKQTKLTSIEYDSRVNLASHKK